MLETVGAQPVSSLDHLSAQREMRRVSCNHDTDVFITELVLYGTSLMDTQM